jgi:hypothetical protein
MTLLQTTDYHSMNHSVGGPHWSGGNLSNAEVAGFDTDRVFHSWSAQSGPQAIPLVGGSGSMVWDHDGNHYLDFSTSWCSLTSDISTRRSSPPSSSRLLG